jgi:signal transduction histidine kinase
VANSFLQQIEFSEQGEVSAIHTYGRAEGLVDLGTESLAEDHDGNLWVGTYTGGAMKITRKGFTRYGRSEGFSRVRSVFEDKVGDVVIVSEPQTKLHWLDGRGFHTIDIDAMKRVKFWSWGDRQITFQDHVGEWWIPTAEGLLRFSNVPIRQLAHAQPKAVYSNRDGLGSNDIFRLFEDRRGDIWISTIAAGPSGLSRWERTTGRIRQYTSADGLPPGIPAGTATAFGEDAEGNLWIGFYKGALARYRDGRFQLFGAADDLSGGTVQAIYLDHAHRLWLAKSSGLSRILDAGSATPGFTPISSGNVMAVTEDQLGRLFLCTERGIERLNPEDGTATHYTAADGGLALDNPSCVLRDHKGTIWMGSAHHGLIRFMPRNEPGRAPPPILLTGLRIYGVAQPVSELGQTEIAPLALPPERNQLQIDFVGPGFTSADEVRYEYMLEGAGQEWSAPAAQRTVHLAGLRPGKYRFIVRSVTAAGAASLHPASFAFTILPPIWQRWWFELIAALTVLGGVYAAYRYRMAHLLQLERVRSRLAIDLHDDIGSGLAEIAILTEVAKTRGTVSGSDVLDRVAGRARSLRESMSDIVWAVDPRLDTLGDLLRRMRQATFGLLAAEGMEVDFLAPSDGDVEGIEVAAERRKHLLLLFKEALTNIARHAHASRVIIELQVKDHELRLDVRDDGLGFEPERSNGGNGLRSMRMRAKELKAELEIDSQRPGGTRIGIVVPLRD